jgi:hypothetical protein
MTLKTSSLIAKPLSPTVTTLASMTSSIKSTPATSSNEINECRLGVPLCLLGKTGYKFPYLLFFQIWLQNHKNNAQLRLNYVINPEFFTNLLKSGVWIPEIFVPLQPKMSETEQNFEMQTSVHVADGAEGMPCWYVAGMHYNNPSFGYGGSAPFTPRCYSARLCRLLP